MKVTIVDFKLPPKKTRWGTVEQKLDMSYVCVDGKSAGYVPLSGEFKGIFHPLAGFPEELCEQVVKGHKDLKGWLKPQPVHSDPEEAIDESDDDDELDATPTAVAPKTGGSL